MGAALTAFALLIQPDRAFAQQRPEAALTLDPIPSPDADMRRAFQDGVKAYDSQDYATAYDIWLPLSKSGDLGAKRNIAHLVRMGLGVPKDSERALRLYRDAAESGLVTAQVNLGAMYLNGEGTAPAPERAARWFYRAAKAGHPQAQFILAGMLESGTGIEADRQAAAAYYMAAARTGYAPALAALEQNGIKVSDGESGRENGVGGQRTPILNLPEKDIRLLYGGTFAD